MGTDQAAEDVRLHVENVGGIDETDVEFSPGVTVLSGRNATNRTSLLLALMAALGSDEASLKGDADRGSVALEFGGETYTRTLERRGGDVATGGDPYLADPELADRFAFLLESNEARRAVERGDDLHDVIMRPVDTDAIAEEIEALKAERERLDRELEAIDERKGELPELEAERERLRSEIEATRESLAQTESALESAEVSVDESRAEREELEERLAQLRETRRELEDIRYDIETEEESIASLKEERAELSAELEELPDPDVERVQDVEPEIDRLREQKQRLNADVGDLQSTIQFNEEMLEEGRVWAEGADAGDAAVTDQLLADGETVRCWTCGSAVEEGEIQATLDQLRERRREKLAAVNDIQDRLDELVEERKDLEAARERREQLERRRATIESEIEDRTERLETLREEREATTGRVAELEAEIETLESEDFGEVLDLHREANQLEFELEGLEADLDSVTADIEELEDRIDEEERLRDEREEVRATLEECRSRIDRIESEAVAEFNDHMDTVLDVLEYDNLERIWIERAERSVREGRRTVTRTTFDLHVVRATEGGATYEDTVDHLSESEREVTGLVFALAGYLVHDVHETLPFMLLDSLEAVDADRIATLVDYLRHQADYLVVALLEEDAAALPDAYERVTDI